MVPKDTMRNVRSYTGAMRSKRASFATRGSVTWQRTSEFCEVSEVSLIRVLCSTQDYPMMPIVDRCRFLDRPVQICLEEGYRPLDPGKVVVVHDHDSSLAHQPPEIKQVNKDTVEVVVAIDEGEIELPPFLQKRRQSNL